MYFVATRFTQWSAPYKAYTTGVQQLLECFLGKDTTVRVSMTIQDTHRYNISRKANLVAMVSQAAPTMQEERSDLDKGQGNSILTYAI